MPLPAFTPGSRFKLGTLLLGASFATQGLAQDACDGFKWNVRPERTLYAGPATALTAGSRRATAPVMHAGHLYRLELERQTQVTFVVAPGKQMTRDDTYGGLAILQARSRGNHRVAVDVPLWIDVVADGQLLPPLDFQSREGCSAPHKIVVFPLRGRRLVLQLSGSTQPSIEVTVVRERP